MTCAGCVLLLLLSGCFTFELHADIHDDGAGEADIRLTVHESFLEWLSTPSIGAFESRTDACADFLTAMSSPYRLENGAIDGYPIPPSGSVNGRGVDTESSALNRDGQCVFVRTLDWGADDFYEALRLLSVNDTAPLIRRSMDGGWRFDLPISEQTTSAPDSFQGLTAIGVDMPSVRISIALPGTRAEHNADWVRGSTFGWHFGLHELPGALFAQTTPHSPEAANLEELVNVAPETTRADSPPSSDVEHGMSLRANGARHKPMLMLALGALISLVAIAFRRHRRRKADHA